MPKFRKKPVIIEAVKALDLINNANRSDCASQPIWIREYVDKQLIVFSEDFLMIKTIDGMLRAEKDDYVIRDAEGDVYPCKLDVFQKTYELIEEEYKPYDLGDVH